MSTTVVTAYCGGRKRSMRQSIRDLVSANRYAPYFPQFFVFNISNLFGSQTQKRATTFHANTKQLKNRLFMIQSTILSASLVCPMFGNDELEGTVTALPGGDSGMQRSPLAFNNNNNNNNNNNRNRVTQFPQESTSHLRILGARSVTWSKL
jgi:hypothetical protein